MLWCVLVIGGENNERRDQVGLVDDGSMAVKRAISVRNGTHVKAAMQISQGMMVRIWWVGSFGTDLVTCSGNYVFWRIIRSFGIFKR